MAFQLTPQQSAAQKMQRREEWRRTLFKLGFVARIATYAALMLVAYSFVPSENIADKPFASLTLNDLWKTAFPVIAIFVLIRALFNPADEDDIRKIWSWWGVILLGAVVVLLCFPDPMALLRMR